MSNHSFFTKLEKCYLFRLYHLFQLNWPKLFFLISFLAPFPALSSFVSIGPVAIKVDSPRELQDVSIYKMLQGQAGFIWFATNQGLWRFDGTNLKKYQYEKGNQNTVLSNWVSSIAQDSLGNIWLINSGKGLSQFNPKNEQFTHFQANEDDPNTLSSNNLYGIYFDRQDNLWIGASNGINILDTKALLFRHVDLNMTPLDGREGPKVYYAYPDSKGNVWLTVREHGFFRYDTEKRKLHKYETVPNDPTTKVEGLPTVVYEEDDGTIWLTSSNAVNKYLPESDSFKRIYPNDMDGNLIEGLFPEALIRVDSNKLAVGTINKGLGIIDKTEKKIKILNPSNAIYKYSISDFRIHDMLLDSSGVLWVSSYPSGLYQIPRGAFLSQFKLIDEDLQSSFSTAYSVDASFLVGHSNGLSKLDARTENLSSIDELGGAVAIAQSAKKNSLYVLFNDVGLREIDLGKMEVKPVARCNDVAEKLAGNRNVKDLVYLDEKLYIGFFKDFNLKVGILSLDLKSCQLTELNTTWNVTGLVELEGSILASTRQNGLNLLNTKSTQWEKVAEEALAGRELLRIFKARDGAVWASIDGVGLAKVALETGLLDIVSMEDGLSSNRIFTITEDSDGILWLGSAQGVSAFDPKSSSIENFTINDGIRGKGNAAYWSAINRNDDILMASYKWLLTFNAKKLLALRKQKTAPSNILLSDFRLFNKPMDTQAIDPQSPLEKSINNLDEITLEHDDSWFSLAFASSNYQLGERLRYAYQMQGLSDKWIEADKGNQLVSFSSLAPKNYVLKIRSGDGKGWHDNVRALKVNVLPPWWLTWQAYVLYVALFVFCGWAFYRFRTKALVKKAEELERGIAERTETINQLMAQKDRMFANISHEFKTPLTLILNPLENIKRSINTVDFDRKVAMMKRNSKRLLRMVDQLLELSKLETTENEKRDLYSLQETLNVLITSFQPLIDSKNMTLSCDEYDDVILSLKPDALEIILTNLISNAVKYTPRDGAIEIKVVKAESEVVISVKDSGIGIDPDSQVLVFNRFTRAEDLHGESIPGAGIGLALVKELVESHGGRIELQSQLGEGSTFTVTLPITHEHTQNVEGKVTELSHSSLLEIDALSASVTPVVAVQQFNFDSDKPTLLLIDDNADMLELLQATLSDKFNCLNAQNGTEGLEIAKECLPDLVISDVMMPGISGFEVVRNLKEDPLTCHLPVILLTAKGDTESRIRGWSEKADEYLEKPFNSLELRMRIDNLLDIRKLLRQRLMREFSELKGQAAQIHVKRSSEFMPLDSPQDDENEELTLNQVNQKFLEKVNVILEKHYKDETMDVTFLAKELAISPRQLSRKMKAVLDLSPVESIRSFRLKKAASLLAEGHSPSVVAHQVGFSSHSYFSKCFKAQYNCLPSSFN